MNSCSKCTCASTLLCTRGTNVNYIIGFIAPARALCQAMFICLVPVVFDMRNAGGSIQLDSNKQTDGTCRSVIDCLFFLLYWNFVLNCFVFPIHVIHTLFHLIPVVLTFEEGCGKKINDYFVWGIGSKTHSRSSKQLSCWTEQVFHICLAFWEIQLRIGSLSLSTHSRLFWKGNYL